MLSSLHLTITAGLISSNLLTLPSLQLADDFSQTRFPVQILIGLDAAWQFLKADVIYGYPTAKRPVWDILSLEDSFLPLTVPMITKQLHSLLQQVTPLTASHLKTGNGIATLMQRILRYTAKLQISYKLKH